VTNYNDIPLPDGSAGWTAPTEVSYFADCAQYIRAGIKSGNYSSGTATVRLQTDAVQPFVDRAAQVVFESRGAFRALAVAASLVLFVFAAQPAGAQVPGGCQDVPGHGYVCNSRHTFTTGVTLPAVAISALPTCNAALAGTWRSVNNGVASPSYRDAVSTTGAATQAVYCDGSGWTYR
jgi:hypothetical protein